MRRRRGLGGVIGAATLALAMAAAPAQAAPGDLDPSFSDDGKLRTDFGPFDDGEAVAVQSDGRIVVAGDTGGGRDADSDFAVARYRPGGRLDKTFSGDGRKTTDFRGPPEYGFDEYAYDVAIQADAKIVVVGKSGHNDDDNPYFDFAIARYNHDGSLDKSFAGDGRRIIRFPRDGAASAQAVAVQDDGRIVLAGYTLTKPGNYDFGVVRLTPAGDFDLTFSGDGMQTTDFASSGDFGRALAIQNDGKIVVAGEAAAFGGDFGVARYLPNGSPDATFSGNGKDTADLGGANPVGGVTVQDDGRIVVAGQDRAPGEDWDFALARFGPTGGLDSSFSGDGKQITDFAGGNDYGEAVAVQDDGMIVVAGQAGTPARSGDFGLARYEADGSLDQGFGGDGRKTTDFGGSESGQDLALQSDGRIVVAGTAYGHRGDDLALARYRD